MTNPGPIQDAFLAETEAQPGLINGAQRTITEEYTDRLLDLGLMARDIFPGGQIGAWGTGVPMHAGHVNAGDGPSFDDFHEARFITETAIARFTEAGASDNILHQAWLWNGYSYRILGEWWCDTVLPTRDPTDTSPSEYIPGTTDPYFERAVESFTQALSYATNADQRNAALAGRASAHLWLGNWSEAYADADAVDDTEFTSVVRNDDSETDLYNYLAEANSGTFRSYTVDFTWYKDYYEDTGDPRVPSEDSEEFPFGVGSLTGFGQVPYRPQLKYTSRTDPINLSSYWEMQLVKAEAILQGADSGDPEDAMEVINDVRTRSGVEMDALPTNVSDAEAWEHLKRERRIELWLEGRNAPDERRWNEFGTPGEIDIPEWEDPEHPGYTPHFASNPRGLDGGPLCWDIPTGERDQNPNVPSIQEGS
ncbi:MAG: RagB/SusD family nutrient uptake outer membrane protein [Gemmatimonadota bacterium]|nr:RagB/SusD family nutrient uptake outer membrane protein [Gemmatimonadota bacterium]